MKEIIDTKILIDKIGYIIGFISNVENKYMIYKVKQLYNPKTKKYNPRNKGARCDQAAKTNTIALINLILLEDKYTGKQNPTHKYFCVLQELILRLYDYNQKDGKRWFFSPSETIINDIENLELIKK